MEERAAVSDRVAGRRDYSAAAERRKNAAADTNYKNIALVLLVIACFTLTLYSTWEDAEASITPPGAKVRVSSLTGHYNLNPEAQNMRSRLAAPADAPPLRKSALEESPRSDPASDPALQSVDSPSPPQQQPTAKHTLPPSTPERAVAGNVPTGTGAKHDQSYYRPFTGGFWSRYPDAKRVLEEYVSRANGQGTPLKGFVKYIPMAEMCNQLLGLVASFTTALVTDRRFTVGLGSSNDWYPRVFDTSPAFQWWLGSLNHLGVEGKAEQTFTNRQHSTDNGPSAFPMEMFLCDEIRSKVPAEVLTINVNQYFVPLLAQNAHYKPLIDALGDDVFRPLGRFLLQPTEKIANQVDAFRRQNMDGKFVVGIHLRAGGGWPATEDQWGVYWEAAKDAERLNVHGLPVVWFLAADLEKVRTHARSTLGSKVVMNDVIFDNRDLGDLYGSAFADVLLLAECDHIVTSSWSTYSYVAAGLAGIKPTIVTEPAQPQSVDRRRGGAEVKWAGLEFWSSRRSTFKNQPTSQPCFHFYFNWRVQDARCFDPEEHIESEYMGGERYC